MADPRRGKEYEPSTVNGYRLSWNGEEWQAVKDGIVQYKHSVRKTVYNWALKNK